MVSEVAWNSSSGSIFNKEQRIFREDTEKGKYLGLQRWQAGGGQSWQVTVGLGRGFLWSPPRAHRG